EDSFVSGIVVEDAKLGAGVLQPLFLAAVNALPTHTDRPASGMLYGTESVSFCYPGDNEEPLALNRAQGDPQTNTVTLRGEVSDGSPVYVEDSVTVDLIGTDLLITKATSQPLAYIGQDVTYTILLENKNQTYAIDNIEVIDSFIGEIDLA